LLAAGYAEKDIGHVLGRVLAEGQGEPESVCTASELPVPRAVVESLVARGSLSVWGLTTDGERLFAATEFDRVRVLHALEELGLASFQTSLDAPGQDLVSEVQRLESQLDVVRGWLARVLGKRRKARAPANDKPTKPKSVGLFSRRKRNADREG
jgi:hypothetical protein